MTKRELETKPCCNDCGAAMIWSKQGWICPQRQLEKRGLIAKREVKPVANREVEPR